MKKLLFFDLETTGLPTSFHIEPSETQHWPNIVEIAWLITDYNSNTVLEEKQYIIKPEGYVIPEDSVKVHKITQQRAELEGISIKEVIKEFLEDLNKCNILIAHNIEFDKNVLTAELYRQNINPDILDNPLEFCTMKTFTDYCEIKNSKGYGYKWPTLNELHQKVLGSPMINMHNAMADVYATKLCFYQLKNENYFELLTKEEQDEKSKRIIEINRQKLSEKKLKDKKQIFLMLLILFSLFLFLILLGKNVNVFLSIVIVFIPFIIFNYLISKKIK